MSKDNYFIECTCGCNVYLKYAYNKNTCCDLRHKRLIKNEDK